MRRPSPLDELFDDPAIQHLPQGRRAYMREAARLAATGLAPRDIGQALGLTACGVAELLREHRAAKPSSARPW